MYRFVSFLLAVLLASPSATALCLTGEGWEPLTFENIEPNNFDISEAGDILVTGNNSASFMVHPLMVNLDRTPILTWRWRVDAAGEPTDLTGKDGDDRPVAVYVAFPYDPDTASFSERMRRTLVEASQGSDAPGRIIAYIWGGKQPAGTRYQNPYTGSESHFVIVEMGDAPKGEWRLAEMNIAEDYQSLFGVPMNMVQYVAVFSDSDDSKSLVEAQITEICFKAR